MRVFICLGDRAFIVASRRFWSSSRSALWL